MRMEKSVVRSQGDIVATVDVQQFDTLDEAVSELDAETVLGLVNAQHRANVTNAARAKATEEGRKQAMEIAKAAGKGPQELARVLAKFGITVG